MTKLTSIILLVVLAYINVVHAFGPVPDAIQKYATQYLKPAITSNQKYLDEVCSKSECNPVIKEMRDNNGLDSFISKTKINNGMALPDDKFTMFIDMISNDLQMDENAKFEWKEATKAILKSDKPVTFRTIGCDKENKCKFLTLVGTHDSSTRTSDISIINTELAFEFAPDIFIVRKTEIDANGQLVTTDVVESKASTKNAGIDQLFKFFEIIAFEALLDNLQGGKPFFLSVSDPNLKKIPALNETAFMDKWGSYIMEVKPANERTMDEEMRLQSGFLPFLTGLAGAVQSVTGAWQGIVGAFASSYSRELQDMRTNRGFDSFKSSMKTFSGEGLPHERSEEFLNDLSGRLDIPGQYRDDFQFMAKWIQFFDSQTWTQSDINFSKGNGGTTNNFNFFAQNRPEDSKMNIVYVTCNQDFTLADDIYVWVTRKSTLGGLFSSTKTEIEKKPAAITQEQLQFVSEWFLLLAYQELSRFMGIACPGDCQNPVPPS